ncbi:tetratricopeptide repeat protein [Sphingomonas panacisoli]|uniref:histidine kinase n=1 Tax=Sphingomonas panacisoli TaxID=1813879 RepID=A0A5B8LGD9_9SPHN|nr:ATP-binding protein [Sphingomonas panacisoli]QDZ07277.1 tetratricopeptide repeat protein [Sphingomonas panacisoli]
MTVRRLHLLIVMLCAVLAGAAPVAAQTARTASFEAAVADARASMMTDPNQAIGKAQTARKIATADTGPDRAVEIATTQWLEGEAHLRLNDPGAAGPLIEAAYATLKELPATKLKGDVLRSRGGYHATAGKIAAALSDYQAAFEIYRTINDTRSEAIALLGIAALYQDATDYESALKKYNQALDIYRGDPQLLVAMYNNRGDMLKELERYPAAEADFRAALKLARDLDSTVLQAQILRNLAWTQLRAGKLAAADQTVAEGFRLPRDRDSAGSTALFWSVAAQASLQRGNLDQARAQIERAFADEKVTEPTMTWWQAHKTAFDIYKKLGQSDRALVHLEALKQLDDNSSKVAASANTALMGARFDSANQDLKIAKLQGDQAKRAAEYERAKALTQFWIFVGSGITAAVIIGMLGFGLVTIRKSRDQVRAANVDLASTNVALGKALAAKTEFLATTSHEIRTPLNGILGMTQVMLADQKLDAGTRDRINVVHGAGVSMRALVDDILDVAKMETGNLTVEKAPVDLPAMLRDVSRMWEDQARAKGLTFDLDVSAAPSRIESDPARLRQVAFNLLSNALKFTQTGSIHVSSTVIAGADGEQVAIVVRDTGIGVPTEKLDLIFESFRQADAGTTRQFGGTGLGLAICRNIAHAMGGDVTVESVEGQGSTFTFAVPLVRVAEEVPVEAEEGGAALLIVDKNPISRAMLKTLFTPRVPAIRIAGSITDAAAAIAEGGIDRVLTDELTIAMDGDAIDGVRALAGVPLSLLWTNPNDDDRARFAAAGVDQLIAKPIAGAALVKEIVTATYQDDIDSRAA